MCVVYTCGWGIHVCTCGSQRLNLGVLFHLSPYYCLKQGLSLSLVLSDWLNSQPTNSKDPISFSNTRVTNVCHQASFFNVGAEDPNSGPDAYTASTLSTSHLLSSLLLKFFYSLFIMKYKMIWGRNMI